MLRKGHVLAIVLITVSLVIFFSLFGTAQGVEKEIKLSDTVGFRDSEVTIPNTTLWAVKDELRKSNEELRKSNELNAILGISGMVIAVVAAFGGWLLSNRSANKVIRAMVEIANAGYRILKVDSGKVAIRDDGKIGADLVKVVGGKRIVARQTKTHTTDVLVGTEEQRLEEKKKAES